jgi:hypothetical protein
LGAQPLGFSGSDGPSGCLDDFDDVAALFAAGPAGSIFDDGVDQFHDVDVEVGFFKLQVFRGQVKGRR